MKIVIASDSFKGSLSSIEIGNICKEVIMDRYDNAKVVIIPMSDGGEGTVEAVVLAKKGKMIDCVVKDPLNRDIQASYGIFDDKAIMEMATASGITLVEDHNRDIFKLNTYGTGQLILEAINKGIKDIYIGIGGSATNDCGIGFSSALGVKYYDINDNELEPIPLNFKKIERVDVSNLNPLLKDVNINVICDVNNPLLGEFGATNVFGKQKGASQKDRVILEEGITHFINKVETTLNKEVANEKGAGAAGGLGAALKIFTNSKMTSGIDTILEITDLNSVLEDADLVITGEGRIDYQSAFGKVVSGVGKLCKAKNIPCVCIVGSVGEKSEEMLEYGINAIVPIVDSIMPLEKAISDAPSLYKSTLNRVLGLLDINIHVNK